MKTTFRVLTIATALFSILACNLLTPKPSTDNAPGQTSSSAGSQSSGACANALYPVKQGATWTYASTGGPTGPSAHTDTITEVRADGFTLTSQYGSLTRTQEWACKPEGLVALQLGGGPSGAISTSNLQGEFTTSNIQGVTILSNVTPGSDWTNSLDIQGKLNMPGGAQATSQGHVEYHLKGLNMESVTVPAGTFDAMKVSADTTITMQVTVQGTSVPVTYTSTSMVWYAPGVGLVKESDTLQSQIFSGTVETQLQSYTIP